MTLYTDTFSGADEDPLDNSFWSSSYYYPYIYQHSGNGKFEVENQTAYGAKIKHQFVGDTFTYEFDIVSFQADVCINSQDYDRRFFVELFDRWIGAYVLVWFSKRVGSPDWDGVSVALTDGQHWGGFYPAAQWWSAGGSHVKIVIDNGDLELWVDDEAGTPQLLVSHSDVFDNSALIDVYVGVEQLSTLEWPEHGVKVALDNFEASGTPLLAPDNVGALIVQFYNFSIDMGLPMICEFRPWIFRDSLTFPNYHDDFSTGEISSHHDLDPDDWKELAITGGPNTDVYVYEVEGEPAEMRIEHYNVEEAETFVVCTTVFRGSAELHFEYSLFRETNINGYAFGGWRIRSLDNPDEWFEVFKAGNQGWFFYCDHTFEQPWNMEQLFNSTNDEGDRDISIVIEGNIFYIRHHSRDGSVEYQSPFKSLADVFSEENPKYEVCWHSLQYSIGTSTFALWGILSIDITADELWAPSEKSISGDIPMTMSSEGTWEVAGRCQDFRNNYNNWALILNQYIVVGSDGWTFDRTHKTRVDGVFTLDFKVQYLFNLEGNGQVASTSDEITIHMSADGGAKWINLQCKAFNDQATFTSSAGIDETYNFLGMVNVIKQSVVIEVTGDLIRMRFLTPPDFDAARNFEHEYTDELAFRDIFKEELSPFEYGDEVEIYFGELDMYGWVTIQNICITITSPDWIPYPIVASLVGEIAGADTPGMDLEMLSTYHGIINKPVVFFFHKSGLIGGTVDTLDGLDPTDLEGTSQPLRVNSIALVITDTDELSYYIAKLDPAVVHAPPGIIKPALNPGDWYWEKVKVGYSASPVTDLFPLPEGWYAYDNNLAKDGYFYHIREPGTGFCRMPRLFYASSNQEMFWMDYDYDGPITVMRVPHFTSNLILT